MRNLAILVLFMAALAYCLPLVNEDANTPCSALEKRYLSVGARGDRDLAAFGRVLLGGLQRASNGVLAEDFVRKQYPDLPLGIGCAVAYWRTFGPLESRPLVERSEMSIESLPSTTPSQMPRGPSKEDMRALDSLLKQPEDRK